MRWPVKPEQLNAANISLCLVVCMFCLPFINPYHHLPNGTFYNEWLAGMLGALALWPLITKPFWHALALPRVSLLWLLLLLFTYVQALFIVPSAPHLALIQGYLIWAFLLTTLGAQLRLHFSWKTIIPCLAWSLLLANSINGGFVVLQLLQHSGFALDIPRFEHYGLLAQSNHFANFVSLGMVSILYLHTQQSIRTRWTILGLAIGLVMLSLSGSRSALLYLIAIALLSGWLFVRLRQQTTITQTTHGLLKLSLCLLPSFLILQLVINAWLPDDLIQTPLTRAMAAFRNPAASLRWQFWQTSLSLFSQSPLWGMGVGQMRWQTFLIADQPSLNPAQLFFEHAHNLLLNVMAEMGLIGLFIVLGALCVWTVSFFRRQAASLEAWWILGCVSIILIHSQLEYPLWYGHFLGVFAFLLGLGETANLSLAHFSQGAKRLLRATLIGICVYCVWQLILMQQANQTLEQQIQISNQSTMSPVQKQAFVDKMLWIDQYTLLAPYAHLLLAIYFTPQPAQATLQRSITESAVRFIPLRRPCLNLILILALQHQDALAQAHLKRLLAVAKGNLEPDIQQLPAAQATLIHDMLRQLDAKATATSKASTPR